MNCKCDEIGRSGRRRLKICRGHLKVSETAVFHFKGISMPRTSGLLVCTLFVLLLCVHVCMGHGAFQENEFDDEFRVHIPLKRNIDTPPLFISAMVALQFISGAILCAFGNKIFRWAFCLFSFFLVNIVLLNIFVGPFVFVNGYIPVASIHEPVLLFCSSFASTIVASGVAMAFLAMGDRIAFFLGFLVSEAIYQIILKTHLAYSIQPYHVLWTVTAGIVFGILPALHPKTFTSSFTAVLGSIFVVSAINHGYMIASGAAFGDSWIALGDGLCMVLSFCLTLSLSLGSVLLQSSDDEIDYEDIPEGYTALESV